MYLCTPKRVGSSIELILLAIYNMSALFNLILFYLVSSLYKRRDSLCISYDEVWKQYVFTKRKKKQLCMYLDISFKNYRV